MEEGIYVSGICQGAVERTIKTTGTKYKEVNVMVRNEKGVNLLKLKDYGGLLPVDLDKPIEAMVNVRAYVSKVTGLPGLDFVVMKKIGPGNGHGKTAAI